LNLDRVVLASGNAGKLREFRALFAPLGIELIPQSEFGVPEAADRIAPSSRMRWKRPATPAA
jgi:inosine/xanthosine triphosphate pyrophosphatase family protein